MTFPFQMSVCCHLCWTVFLPNRYDKQVLIIRSTDVYKRQIWDYLTEVWATMKDAIHRGLEAEGVLPGPLNLRRKASTIGVFRSCFPYRIHQPFLHFLCLMNNSVSPGEYESIHATALGKVMISEMSEEEIYKLFEEMCIRDRPPPKAVKNSHCPRRLNKSANPRDPKNAAMICIYGFMVQASFYSR